MASFNKVILMGNLTKDPETVQTQGDSVVVKFSLALNDRVPDGAGGYKEQVSFIDCVIFKQRAEAFARFMRKGSSVLIEGRLRQDTWQDKDTGQNRSKVGVVAFNWEFAGAKPDAQAQGGGGSQAPQGGGQIPDDVHF